MQQLRDNQMAHPVMNRTVDENDPLFQKARENVVCPLTPAGLLDDHGNERIHIGINGIEHENLPALLWIGTLPEETLPES
jgi:hypothetical protein